MSEKRNPGGQAGAPIQNGFHTRDAMESTTPPYRKQPPPQFFRLATHLHALGVRPVAECLLELAGVDELIHQLERYARLSPEIVEALGADKFPPFPLLAVPDVSDDSTCGPVPIGDAAGAVVADLACRTLVFHLEAATTNNDGIDLDAIRSADAIRRRAGWTWLDVIQPPAELGKSA